MFGELPKVFDRDFAIAYFIPVAAFLAASLQLLSGFGLVPGLETQLQQNLAIGTTVVGLVSWLIGVLLMAINREIYRTLEGYGRFNPARLLGFLEKRRFQRLQAEIQALDDKYRAQLDGGEPFPREERLRRDRLMFQAARRFPEDESQLLPTAFGNCIRAFEVYPRVMYGVEAIQGWVRLLAFIPKEFRSTLDSAKAQTDFWVNVIFLSILYLIEYCVVAVYAHQMRSIWVPALALGIAWVASYRARGSAIGWGEMVKASFDAFLPKLEKAVGFAPGSQEQDRERWTRFSQAIIYRLPELMPERSQPAPGTENGGSIVGSEAD